PAIVRRAEVGAALHHLAWNADVGRVRVVALLGGATARIVDRAAGFLNLAVVLVPVGRPLPDIAGHLMKAVPIRRKRADRCGPLVSVLAEVLPRKLALPCIGERFAARHELVAPAELGAV